MNYPWLKSVYDSEVSGTQDIHGIVSPAEVRYGEPVVAVAKSSKHNLNLKVRVWRISPFGIELAENTSLENLCIGDEINFDINVAGYRSNVVGSYIAKNTNPKGMAIYGFRFFDMSGSTGKEWSGEDRRSGSRWSTSLDFMPTGFCANPGKFNDFIYFKVMNISAAGMQIQTSLRNKFLIAGMKLNTTLSLPAVSNVNLSFKIMNVSIGNDKGKDVLNVGCRFEEISSSVKECIGQYVFQFGPSASLTDLKKEGLYVSKASRGVEFKFVRTKEEYDRVIELRKKAYLAAGKVAENDDLSDIFDSRSRIVVGTQKGKVVCSLRVIFNEASDRMEHDDYVIFPKDFPPKHEICEITRVCTDPEYRGSDLLLSLFRFVAVTVAQSGRRYILGCATNELLPLYARLGFKSTGIRYHYKALNNLEHTIFMGDIIEGLTGKGVNPLVWNIVWKDVIRYLSDHNVCDYSTGSKLRMQLFRLAAPFAEIMMRRKKKR